MQRVNVKPKVEPGLTLRLVTQAAMGVAPWWSRLGPRLAEPPHFKVHLEGHATPLHMSCIWLPSCYWTNWHMPPQAFSPIVIKLNKHSSRPYSVPINV
jgi:hypothetical protein